MSETKVGLVVLTSNDKDYIEQCLASVKRQTYENLQVVVFDDNSDDETWAFIKELLKGTEWQCAHSTEQFRTGKALDDAMTLLRPDTEYIMTFCGDDVMAPKRVELLAKALDEADDDTVVAYDAFYQLVHHRRRPTIFPIQPADFDPVGLVHNNYITGVAMFKKKAFEEHVGHHGFSGYDENGQHAEDYWRWLQMLTLAGKKAVAVRDPLWVYRRHPDQKSNQAGETTRCRLMVQQMAVTELMAR